MTSTAPAPPARTLCARRGSHWLSPRELEAHLAAALRLENVGVFLGAGCSLAPLGGLTVPQLWKKFEAENAPGLDWLRAENFLPSRGPVDLEHLLDALEVTRLEWKRVRRPRKLAQLTRVRAELLRTVVRGSLLEPEWWRRPGALDADAGQLADHRGLLQKLTAARQPGQPSPWLFTSNYDLAIEWASETLGLKVTNGFDGLHRRVFSPHNFHLGYRNTLARGEARFGTYNIYLAKLHGSLTWKLAPDGIEEFPAHALWTRIASFLNGDSDDLDSHIVYPSIAKYVSTVGFVLGELLRRFTEFMARPQTCLIVSGYSYSDEHLNKALATALQNPTLQLVLYCPKATQTDESLELEGCSDWIRRVAGLESPQVTIVGGGKEAHFRAMVGHLPDPAVYDEQAAQIRAMIKEYSEFSKHASGGSSP